MRKRIISLIMAICMVFSLIPGASAAEAPVTVTILGQENATYAAGVFDLVNQVREENGLAPVTRNATLSELAMQRAAEAALYYSHTRPDGNLWSTVLDGEYSGWYNAGENLAAGQQSPEDVMDSWMNSEGHRGNILNSEFTQIGIGCFYSDGVYCWIQLFSNSTSNTAETTETGVTDASVQVEILPSNLNLDPSGTQQLELEAGESHSFAIRSVNPEFDYVTAILMAAPGSSTDADDHVIATRTVDDNGVITITAVTPGSAVMDIPVYDGQPDALRLHITVPQEEIPTTAPTEPAPTETEPVETEPVETEPVETEPVETEPVETEPVETEPVETEPVETEPVETEPVETEPVETEPVETEPVETEPVETEPVETEPVETEPTEPDPTEPDDGILASGECGPYATWTLDHKGTLTISGVGIVSEPKSWADYKDQILHIVVEEGIVQICDEAFSRCTSLVTADIADSVNELGWAAFEYCTALTNVTLPNSLYRINPGVFRGCSNLATVVIPDSVAYINEDAFQNCTGLQAIVIPDSVIGMERISFSGCPNLVIYCYNLSYAHLFAVRCDYAFQLMDDEPDTPTYSIRITCNAGGSATITPNPSPANRYVLLEAAPDKGYILDQAYYLCASAPDTKLEFQKVGENQYMFFMPASDVILEICFLATESPFSDVKKGAFYYEPVLWAVSYDITSGVGNGLFAPGNPCTRAQVVTFLWRAAGEPEPVSTRNPFTDVKTSAYYYKAVLWAVENGITTGMSATSFAPNSPCTRGQVVTFLHRAAGEPGYPYSHNPFRDVKESAFYYDAVLWAVNYGITTGMSDTTFAPNSTCTRGQVVTFLYRFLR